MKRLNLLLIAAFHFVVVATAQEDNERWFFGAGITYCSYINSPGVNLNVTYRAIGNFHIGPDFSALLTRERNENGKVVRQKELEFNLNAHYLFAMNERLSIYPLTGINWSKVTIHTDGDDPEVTWLTALNAGGGIEFRLKRTKLFLEPRWVSRLNKIDITLGVILP